MGRQVHPIHLAVRAGPDPEAHRIAGLGHHDSSYGSRRPVEGLEGAVVVAGTEVATTAFERLFRATTGECQQQQSDVPGT